MSVFVYSDINHIATTEPFFGRNYKCSNLRFYNEIYVYIVLHISLNAFTERQNYLQGIKITSRSWNKINKSFVSLAARKTKTS